MRNRRDPWAQEVDLVGQRAGDLIRAWISGDSVRVKRELESILSDHAAARDAGQEERKDLLRVVAVRMKNCPNVLFGPCISLCLSLLGHLAGAETDSTQLERL